MTQGLGIKQQSLRVNSNPKGLIVGGAVPSFMHLVSVLDSASGSAPGRGHCVVFLGKTLHFHGASLQREPE